VSHGQHHVHPIRVTRYDPALPRLVAPWWVVAVLAGLFVVLAIVTRGPNTLRIDANVTSWIQRRSTWWGEPLASFGNVIGESPVAIAFLVVALAVGIYVRHWREVWFLLLAALGRLLGTFLKEMFDSPRPDASRATLHEAFDGFGFPSGHATTASVAAGALAYLLARQVTNRSIHIALGGLWIAAMASTAFARVWYGAHWFSDTLGGALYGMVVVLLAANLSLLIATIADRRPRSPEG
jgi:membrane-associated phospholipid phosphatase